MAIYVGEIPIHYVSAFTADNGSKKSTEYQFLGHDVAPIVAEFKSSARELSMVGTLLQDSGVIKDIDDMAEDILAIKDRFKAFNYLHSFQNRTGWLSVASAESPKDANSLVTRPFSISGSFLPKSLYQPRFHSNPQIRSNDFLFSLGVDDCDNYIAIPIGATYSGGDGSTITRTSKDGDITLVLATTNSDIKWDINEADRLNGECKIFDMMSENLLKNGDFEDWGNGTSSPPNGWTNSGLASITRDTKHKSGLYSAKLAPNSITDFLYYNLENPTSYRDETVSFGCWGWSDTSSQLRFFMQDDGGISQSSYHSGNNTWEWLTVTRTIDAAATHAEIIVYPSATNGFIPGYIDGGILLKESEVPITPVIDTYGVQVFVRDREFTGSMVIENGLYRIMINPSTDHITIYYWNGSEYVHISAFTAGTFTRTTILENTPDCIRVKLDSDVDIELRRGHPPMIDTGITDLITIGLTPSDQSTSTENYLNLGTNLYICSDESFSIVNATKNLDDGKKWMFYETVSATAEDIAHQAMVEARMKRELIIR